MKAILAFALLVIAAQASTPAYFLGFSEQIGLDHEQMKHGSVCFDTVKDVLLDIDHLIQSRKYGVSEVLRSFIVVLEDFDHRLKAGCSHYLKDVFHALLGNVRENVKEVTSRNWNKYFAEIIQQIAIYFDALRSGNAYEAGRTEAYIYQILLGVEQPKVLPMPQFNLDRLVPMNHTKYVIEFTRSYFETLGIHDKKGIQDNMDCAFAQFKFIEIMFTRRGGHGSTYDDMEAFEEFIHDIANLYKGCGNALKFNFQHIGYPILHAFQIAPVHATFGVIHSIARYLPEIHHKLLEMKVDLYEGRYDEVGKLYAEQFIAVFSKIYDYIY